MLGMQHVGEGRIVALAVLTAIIWTIVMSISSYDVVQNGREAVLNEARIHAEAAVGRVRDRLATLTRTSSAVTPVDADGGGGVCVRASAAEQAARIANEPRFFVRLLLGDCCRMDAWERGRMDALIAGNGEQSGIRLVGGQEAYWQMTALPVDRCNGCHPSKTQLPALVVRLPLSAMVEADKPRRSRALVGIGAVWLLGLAFLGDTSRRFFNAVRDVRRLQEDRLRFFDQMPNPAMLVSAGSWRVFGPVLRANRRLADDLGLRPNDVAGRHIEDVLDGMDEVSQEALLHAVKSRGRGLMETGLLAASGPVPVEAEFTLFQHEAVPTLRVSMQDLSDRRAAEQALAKRDRRLALLSSVTRRLAEHLDERLVLRELVASAAEVMEARGAVAGLLADDHVVMTEAADESGRRMLHHRLPSNQGVVGRILESSAPYITNDAANDPLVLAALRDEGSFVNLLAVPIINSEARVLGVLEVYDQVGGPFDDEDALTLMGVASSGAVAIENARAVQQLVNAREQLLAHQSELRKLTEQLVTAEVRERRSIAVDLHDGIGQTLAMMRMKLGEAAAAAPVIAASSLEYLKDLLNDAIEQTRSLTVQLSPPVLRELGLGPALEWLCEKCTNDHEVSCSFVEIGRPRALGQDTRALLYVSTRELLLNAIKHASASRVDVKLEWSDEEIRIDVQDDGKGFDSQPAAHAGYGLFGIRERLRSLDGLLQIESQLGSGTRAWIEVSALNDED